MNNETSFLIGIFALAVLVVGIIVGTWAGQVYALKREMSDAEARLSERMSRCEDQVGRIGQTLQNISNDINRSLVVIERDLSELRGRRR